MDCPYTDAKCGRHAQCKACLVENIGLEWGGDFIKANFKGEYRKACLMLLAHATGRATVKIKL